MKSQSHRGGLFWETRISQKTSQAIIEPVPKPQRRPLGPSTRQLSAPSKGSPNSNSRSPCPRSLLGSMGPRQRRNPSPNTNPKSCKQRSHLHSCFTKLGHRQGAHICCWQAIQVPSKFCLMGSGLPLLFSLWCSSIAKALEPLRGLLGSCCAKLRCDSSRA